MQNNAYSKPGYPDWLKLDDANWETFEAFEDLQRSREAAWEEHSDDREHALRVWREAAGLAASAQPAWSSYALAAGGWWERPRRAVVW